MASSRVLLAHERDDVRERFADGLRANGFEVVGRFQHPAEAGLAAAELRPDLCLFSSRPADAAFRSVRHVRTVAPASLIVLLYDDCSLAMFLDAISHGASGCLASDVDIRALLSTINDVLEGGVAVPRQLMRPLVEQVRPQLVRRRLDQGDGHRGPEGKLTDREWEVLDLLAKGRSTSEIAGRLYVSPVTVRTHISAILRKLDVADRRTAIQRYFGQMA